MNSAASSSAEPPISPIIMTALVSGSASNARRQSMKLVPGTGSPPMPTQVVTPMPLLLELVERLVRERAGAAHDADRTAGLGDVPGGDADVALAGADDAGAVRAEQLHVRVVALQLVEEPRLVVRGHALGDHHDELDAALGRVHHRVLHARRRDEDARRVRAGGRHRVAARSRRSGCRRRRCRPSSGWCRRRPGCRTRG